MEVVPKAHSKVQALPCSDGRVRESAGEQVHWAVFHFPLKPPENKSPTSPSCPRWKRTRDNEEEERAEAGR